MLKMRGCLVMKCVCVPVDVYPIRGLSWTPAPWEPKDTQKSLCQIWQSPTIAMWVCEDSLLAASRTIPASVNTFLLIYTSSFRGIPQRRRSHSALWSLSLLSSSIRFSGPETRWLEKKFSYYFWQSLSLCNLTLKLCSFAPSSLKTLLSTSPPCTTYSGRPTRHLKRCYRYGCNSFLSKDKQHFYLGFYASFLHCMKMPALLWM